MHQTFKHEASEVNLVKEIANPDAIEFNDVFDEAQKYDVDPNTLKPRIWKNEFRTPVGPYCGIRSHGRASLQVKCKDWVMDKINKKMIPIENDSLSFEIVIHDNGWALVLVKYNLILGSRWLAYIKTDSIPFYENL